MQILEKPKTKLNINITWEDVHYALGSIYDEKDCKSLFNKNKKWLEEYVKNEATKNILEAFINHIGDENFPPNWR